MISRQAVERRRRLGLRQLKRWEYSPEECTPRAVGKSGGTRKPCSCCMCGNPRRRLGNSRKAKTLQEAKLLSLDEERDVS
ncbi:hypothetical protein JCM15519_09550 [Fundidesulfovibrio butyratiphilus]